MLFSPLSIFLLLMMTLNRVVVWATQTSVVPKGFVTTNGTQFELDGKPFVSMATSKSDSSCILTVFLRPLLELIHT